MTTLDIRPFWNLSKIVIVFCSQPMSFYVVDFLNIGGLPMPLPLEITYEDGSLGKLTIPAEIWRLNNKKVSKLFITDKEMVGIALDPHRSLADADRSDDRFPREVVPSRFQLFKIKEEPNPMAREREDDAKSP